MEESACQVEIQSLLGVYTHFLEEQNLTYFRFCFIDGQEIIPPFSTKYLLSNGCLLLYCIEYVPVYVVFCV